MTWHYEIKEYYDHADDIEGVNIHYLWTPLEGIPDWENQRVTRFMPLVVQPPSPPGGETATQTTENAVATAVRLRRKILKLPQTIVAPESGVPTDRYLLHHYFEVFQDGHRHYSPLYTEELHTHADARPVASASEELPADATADRSLPPALVKR
ncbi:MAG: hypothetical protein HOP18_02875 [Deltaproteobacteria bacterium]|nr:hypothetical protein [Deltaproteobacteria bacterium]